MYCFHVGCQRELVYRTTTLAYADFLLATARRAPLLQKIVSGGRGEAGDCKPTFGGGPWGRTEKTFLGLAAIFKMPFRATHAQNLINTRLRGAQFWVWGGAQCPSKFLAHNIIFCCPVAPPPLQRTYIQPCLVHPRSQLTSL